MNNEEKIKIFRELLKHNGLERIEGTSSDEELLKLIGSSIIPLSMSVTNVKKILFSYVFLNKDNKEIEKTKLFFEEQLEVKKNLPINIKRVIIFFLKNKAYNDTKRAYNNFLLSYGRQSSTYYAKKRNPFDYLRFSRAYNDVLKPLLNSLKKPDLKKFNGLRYEENGE